MDVHIRPATETDLPAITAMQNALVLTTTGEWIDEPHTVEGRTEWFVRQHRRGFPVLVAEITGTTVGFASYGDFRDSELRPGYRFTVEHTIHVDAAHQGAGIGGRLLEALVDHARQAGKHLMVAAVDGENDASVRFHERCGFAEVARIPEMGAKFGRWLTLVLLVRRLDDAPVPPP